jgi:hypothetical protein
MLSFSPEIQFSGPPVAQPRLGVEDGAWRCKRFDDGANLGLQDDGVNPAQDASVDVTNRT